MKQFERATIDAFVAKDVSLAIAAACINPLSHDDLLTAKVFKKLFTAHKKYLTYFNK
jgi:alpha-galactosidase/6-phospho-beta-glucosidase family protein